jgi:hypothetical protein
LCRRSSVRYVQETSPGHRAPWLPNCACGLRSLRLRAASPATSTWSAAAARPFPCRR